MWIVEREKEREREQKKRERERERRGIGGRKRLKHIPYQLWKALKLQHPYIASSGVNMKCAIH